MKKSDGNHTSTPRKGTECGYHPSSALKGIKEPRAFSAAALSLCFLISRSYRSA